MAVQIVLSDLKQKVEEGWKKNQLAEHYGIPVTQMTRALQQAGLTIRKLHHPKFHLVDDMDQQDMGDVNDSVSEVNHEAEEEILQEMENPIATEENTTQGQW